MQLVPTMPLTTFVRSPQVSRGLFFLSVCTFFAALPFYVDTSLFIAIMTVLGLRASYGMGAFAEVMRSPAAYAVWGYVLFALAALAGTMVSPYTFKYYPRVLVWGACALSGLMLSRSVPEHGYAFFWGTFAALIGSCVFAFVSCGFDDPSLWHSGRLKLFAIHPVRLGLYCSATFLFCLHRYCTAATRPGMMFCAAATLFAGGLTYLTNTRGIILIVPLALIGIALALPRKNLGRFLVGVAVVLALCVTGALTTKSSLMGGRLVSAVTSATADSTFQTRLPIWEAAWESFKTSPIVGHGVRSFTGLHREYLREHKADWDVRYRGLYESRAKHTHNFLLGRLVDSGVVGTAGFFLFYCLAIMAAWRGPQEGRWVAALLVFYMVSSQLDDGFSRINDALIMVAAGAALGFPEAWRRKERVAHGAACSAFHS